MKKVGEQWRLLSKEERESWCFDPPVKKDRSKPGGSKDGSGMLKEPYVSSKSVLQYSQKKPTKT